MSCSLCHWIHHFLAIIYKMCHRPNDLGQCEAVFCRIARQLDHSPPYPKSAICQFRTLTALTWHGNQHHQPAPVILLNITSVLVLSPDIVPSQNGGFAPEVGISPFSHLGNVLVPFSDTSKKQKTAVNFNSRWWNPQKVFWWSPQTSQSRHPRNPQAPDRWRTRRLLADPLEIGAEGGLDAAFLHGGNKETMLKTYHQLTQRHSAKVLLKY